MNAMRKLLTRAVDWIVDHLPPWIELSVQADREALTADVHALCEEIVEANATIAQLEEERQRYIEALDAIREFAAGHNGHQPLHELVHALLVDIPHMCEVALPERYWVHDGDEAPKFEETDELPF